MSNLVVLISRPTRRGTVKWSLINSVMLVAVGERARFAIIYLPHLRKPLSHEDLRVISAYHDGWPTGEITADGRTVFMAVPLEQVGRGDLARLRRLLEDMIGDDIVELNASVDNFDVLYEEILDRVHAPRLPRITRTLPKRVRQKRAATS